MPPTSTTITECSLCQSPLTLVLALAATPPANEILPEFDPDKEVYPLNLMMCDKCHHLQLDTEISKSRLFKHYVYTANTSSSNYAYFATYAKEMAAEFSPKFVVDIGSNDGLFLNFFKETGSKVLGVDPAENIVEIATANGVPTICNFFGEMVAGDIAQKHGKADLITCNNMFAHNRDLGEVLLGVKELLAPHGTFVFEVSYAMSLLEHNLFDLIYHEHFHHWHLTPALEFMNKYGLQVVAAKKIPQTHGGSIRIYVQHDNITQVADEKELAPILYDEQRRFLQLVAAFRSNVEKVRDDVRSLLDDCLIHGKQVSILGYPAKACTLSYYFGLDQNYITNIYDDNVLKIGKYSHLGFQIQPAKHITRDKPDFLLVLSWNYKNELIERNRFFHQTGGKFIIPFPKLEVI